MSVKESLKLICQFGNVEQQAKALQIFTDTILTNEEKEEQLTFIFSQINYGMRTTLLFCVLFMWHL